MTAVVDDERCILCGICVDICPDGAIALEETVVVDSGKCSGCGSCADRCPNEAITLHKIAAS